jgi:hypothetical protein
MVLAVKYDSPHREHDHMGMRSMTRSVRPVPKLRVTRRSCGTPWPQAAHTDSSGIDRDDIEDAGLADFDDDLRFAAVERDAADDDLGLNGSLVFCRSKMVPVKMMFSTSRMVKPSSSIFSTAWSETTYRSVRSRLRMRLMESGGTR